VRRLVTGGIAYDETFDFAGAGQQRNTDTIQFDINLRELRTERFHPPLDCAIEEKGHAYDGSHHDHDQSDHADDDLFHNASKVDSVDSGKC